MIARRTGLLFACLLAAIQPGSSGEPPAGRPDPPPYLAASTRQMTTKLAALLRSVDPTTSYALNPQRAALLRRELAAATDPREILFLRARLAAELLNGGESTASIDELNGILDWAKNNGIDVGPRNRAHIRRQLAVAWLRLGEQENCLLNHTTESCLLPIRKGGVHREPRGSRAAIERLNEVLADQPDDLEARWLLNLAHMTLGEYPEGVPPRWRIDPAAFASEYEVPRFTDVAMGLGLDVDEIAGGAVTEDFDRDGYIDLMVSSSKMTGPLRYFHNDADGTFPERTAQAGLTGEVAALNLTTADYNNDGFVDVLMLRGGWLGSGGQHPNSLLRNNGDGTFDDVTEEAGLLSFHPTQTGAWLDYDNDGLLDLYIGNETGGDFFGEGKPGEGDTHPSELYRNNGDGTFTECAAASGVALIGFIKSVAAGDYDGDGWTDLYVSRRTEENTLLRNTGAPAPGGDPCAWRFEDVTAKAGVAEPKRSFGSWFFDYDNDGLQDLFVVGYGARHVGDVAADYLGLPTPGVRSKLYRNKGDGTFADISSEARVDRVILAMGVNFGDIDGDGWLDIYFGTGDPNLTSLVPNRLLRNDAGKRFQDVTTAAGVGHLQKGHGVSFADIDNDGDQDIYHDLGGAFWGDNYRTVLFANPGHENRWITLKLEGVRSNRAALGARIAVTVKTPEGVRTIHRVVTTGASFGASPLRQEIGLGPAKSIETITIHWPATGRTQTLRGLPMDRFYAIAEEDDRATEVALKRLDLTRPAPGHPHHPPATTSGAARRSSEGAGRQ